MDYVVLPVRKDAKIWAQLRTYISHATFTECCRPDQFLWAKFTKVWNLWKMLHAQRCCVLVSFIWTDELFVIYDEKYKSISKEDSTPVCLVLSTCILMCKECSGCQRDAQFIFPLCSAVQFVSSNFMDLPVSKCSFNNVSGKPSSSCTINGTILQKIKQPLIIETFF